MARCSIEVVAGASGIFPVNFRTKRLLLATSLVQLPGHRALSLLPCSAIDSRETASAPKNALNAAETVSGGKSYEIFAAQLTFSFLTYHQLCAHFSFSCSHSSSIPQGTLFGVSCRDNC